MVISAKLSERCQGLCELCNNLPAMHEYIVSPKKDELSENQVALCDTCLSAIAEKDNGNHWRCLEGSIWNPEPSVQALSYRLLYSYKSEEWANNVISSIDIDENIVQWP